MEIITATLYEINGRLECKVHFGLKQDKAEIEKSLNGGMKAQRQSHAVLTQEPSSPSKQLLNSSCRRYEVWISVGAGVLYTSKVTACSNVISKLQVFGEKKKGPLGQSFAGRCCNKAHPPWPAA
ncbi:unnamed protein product [Caretta caretta]